MGACSDNDSDENVPKPGHTPLTDVQVAPRNPYLASEHYSITHFNSAQTDAFPYAVKDGIFTVNPENCASTWSGPVNLMTLSSTSPDYMWGMSSDRVSYINVKDGKFERIAEAELPDIKKHTKEELEKVNEDYKQDQKQQYAGRMVEKFDRLAKYSLDPDNQKMYANKKEQ